MFNNLISSRTYGEKSEGFIPTVGTKACTNKKRPSQEEVYGNLYANPECISSHIAENVSNQFAQSLMDKGLLVKYEEA